MDGFFSWGLSVGRVKGIEVRIHWTLLAWWVWQLDGVLSTVGSSMRLVAVGVWALAVGLMFLSIFLHELGHCYAASRVGGHATEVLLWPLGGLAYCSAPEFPRSNFLVAAGGPLVTVLIALVSFLGFHLLGAIYPDALRGWSTTSFFLQEAQQVLVRWNVLILIFNLIPIYPLDGGRILHASLWAFFSRGGGYVWGGLSRANLVALQVSRVTGLAGIIWGIYTGDTWIAVIFLYALFGAESLKNR
jgi:Zn-dependent protease